MSVHGKTLTASFKVKCSTTSRKWEHCLPNAHCSDGQTNAALGFFFASVLWSRVLSWWKLLMGLTTDAIHLLVFKPSFFINDSGQNSLFKPMTKATFLSLCRPNWDTENSDVTAVCSAQRVRKTKVLFQDVPTVHLRFEDAMTCSMMSPFVT